MTHVREFEDGTVRCDWASDDPLYIDYHDHEWGNKTEGQNELFEKMSLEGFQAGLSWLTILRRREGFRSAFEGFDVATVANFTELKIAELCEDTRIIRNRSKILAVIHNADLVQRAGLDLTSLLWSFATERLPAGAGDFEWRATSPDSDAMSPALKKLGFKYVGSTTMYALMQSTGMVQDHAPGCFRRP